MRTLLKVTVPVEAGNKAVRDGSMQQIIQATVERIRPEAVYFVEQGGERCGFFFFDLKDVTDIPTIGEPIFQALNARLELSPAMNPQDLQAGLGKLKM
ncbi:MAG TPA: hypothetical protein VHO06_00625 [Polyangia bacterium]|nr:hypothetical protein [Polyangia bacterium]